MYKDDDLACKKSYGMIFKCLGLSQVFRYSKVSTSISNGFQRNAKVNPIAAIRQKKNTFPLLKISFS